MDSLELNNPSITGYSACWGCLVNSLHAHREGRIGHDRSLLWYRNLDAMDDRAVWLYMPVDKGEVVTDVRRRLGRLPFDAALMVRRCSHILSTTCADTDSPVYNKQRSKCDIRIARAARFQGTALGATLQPTCEPNSPLLRSVPHRHQLRSLYYESGHDSLRIPSVLDPFLSAPALTGRELHLHVGQPARRRRGHAVSNETGDVFAHHRAAARILGREPVVRGPIPDGPCPTCVAGSRFADDEAPSLTQEGQLPVRGKRRGRGSTSAPSTAGVARYPVGRQVGMVVYSPAM
jgi:hypothetical protein